MKSSESINELATALVAAQAEMTGASQDSDNPFFGSKYADVTSVLKAVRAPLANHGLSFVQFPITGPENQCGVTTRLMHNSGQYLEDTLLLPMGKYDAQGAGSAITYARRYALAAILGVPAADDDANAVGNPTISAEEVQAGYQKARQLIAKGLPEQFMEWKDSLSEELQTLIYNGAPQGKISAFKKAWTAKEQEFWAPIKVAKAEVPEFVAKQNNDAINEVLTDFPGEYEREKLMGALDDVSVAYIESMEAA